MWRRVYGDAAFTGKIIPQYRHGEDDKLAPMRAKYINMVQSHGLVMLSMGSIVSTGLLDAEGKYVLHRVDEEGEDLPPIKKYVYDILRYDTL